LTLTVRGKKKATTASYTVTEGVTFSSDQPYISLSGVVSGKNALTTSGSFDANFCAAGCGSGAYVVRSVGGTYTATRTASGIGVAGDPKEPRGK
jgi:hypothetical protein